jgi:hypothetical protein
VGNLLSRKEAAGYIKRLLRFGSVSMLAHLARTGDGPVFYRAGKATVYPADALESWCLGRLRIAEAPTAVSAAIVEAEPVSEASEASPDDEAMSDEAIYASRQIDYSAIEAGLRLVAALEGA